LLGGYSDAVGRVTYPVSELLLGNGNDTLLLVERVPELGDNEEVLTLDEAVLDGTGDTLTSLLLVAVVCEEKSVTDTSFHHFLSYRVDSSWKILLTASAIEQTVSGLDSIVNCVCACRILHLKRVTVSMV